VIQLGFYHPRKQERKGNAQKRKKSQIMKEVIWISQSNDVGSKTREHEMIVSTCEMKSGFGMRSDFDNHTKVISN